MVDQCVLMAAKFRKGTVRLGNNECKKKIGEKKLREAESEYKDAHYITRTHTHAHPGMQRKKLFRRGEQAAPH